MLAYLNGYSLHATPRHVSLGTVQAESQKDVSFNLHNLTGSKIEVIGYNTAGFCVNKTSLPLAIDAGQEVEMTFLVRPPRRLAGAYLDVPILLYLDVPGQQLVLQITGTVIPEV